MFFPADEKIKRMNPIGIITRKAVPAACLFFSLVLFFSCASGGSARQIAGDYYMLAKGYADQKNYKKSAEYYKKARRQGDINLAASYELARVYALGGMYSDARLVLEDLLKEEPDNGLVLSAYAYVTTMTGDFEKSLEAYGKLRERNLLDSKTIKNYSSLLFNSGDYMAALAEINKFPTPLSEDSDAMRIAVLSALELCLENKEQENMTEKDNLSPAGTAETATLPPLSGEEQETEVSGTEEFTPPTVEETIKQAESYLGIQGKEQDTMVLSRLMDLYFSREMYREGTQTFEKIPADKRTLEQLVFVSEIYFVKMDDPQLGKGILEQALGAGYRNKAEFIQAVETVDSTVIEEINNLFKKYIEADSVKKQEE